MLYNQEKKNRAKKSVSEAFNSLNIGPSDRSWMGYSTPEDMAMGMIDAAYATGSVSSYSPDGLAGAAVYAANQIFGCGETMPDVAPAANTSIASINSHYENMRYLMEQDYEPRDAGLKKTWATPRQ